MGKMISKTDIARLTENSLTFKKLLDDLERDYKLWNRKQELDDLENIIAQAKRIEIEITQVMSDINSFGNYKGDAIISENLHHAFKTINNLFKDVKMVREEFEKASINPEMIHHMEIDWEKLRKTVETLGNHFKTIETGPELSFF